jgi:hypothetical protein
MKSLVVKNMVAVLTIVLSSPAFSQSLAKPGQIAVMPETVLVATLPSPLTSPAKTRTSFLSNEERHDRKMNRIWVGSMVAMVIATGLDAGSSWGKREGNPLLASSNGTFGTKGLSIKTGMAVGIIVPQLLLRSHKDLRSTFAIGNFAEAALFGGIGIRNLGIHANK